MDMIMGLLGGAASQQQKDEAGSGEAANGSFATGMSDFMKSDATRQASQDAAGQAQQQTKTPQTDWMSLLMR